MRAAKTLSESAVVLLEKLVAFDSVSRNSNLPIIGFIETYVKEQGLTCERIPSPDGSKCNLLARIGPNAAGGMIFSGHTDVVPVDGQEWDSDPFTLTRRGGKLFGRGAADMKAFIAVCLALIPEMIEKTTDKPIWLAFSYDEEIGCLGAPHLLAHIAKHVPAPSFALIGEPTMMRVVTAHKGVMSFETTVHGLEWHSSQPHLGVNAIHIACDLIHFLTHMGAKIAEGGKRDDRFNPPYTTVHVGTLHGGTARNIIPRECVFQWEIRPLPGDNPDALVAAFEARCLELLKTMKHVSSNADIVTRPMSRMGGVTLPPDAHPLCRTVMHAAQTNQEHAVAFGTEAGVFQEHGVPAIICGPGNIEQAHKPNEFIEEEQIELCVEFLLRLMSGKS